MDKRFFWYEEQHNQAVTVMANLLGVYFGEKYEGTPDTQYYRPSIGRMLDMIPGLMDRLKAFVGEHPEYIGEAFKKVVHPEEYYISSNFVAPDMEQPEAFALRKWPKSKAARDAFMVGLTWKDERSKKWTAGYNTRKLEANRDAATAWMQHKSGEIEALDLLTQEEKLKVLEVRIKQICDSMHADRLYHGDNGHW